MVGTAPLQIYCLFLFLFAASLFGAIIAEVNEIVVQFTMESKGLDRILESYLTIHPRQEPQSASYLVIDRIDEWPTDVRLDARTMFKVRKWERFRFKINYEFHHVSMSFL